MESIRKRQNGNTWKSPPPRLADRPRKSQAVNSSVAEGGHCVPCLCCKSSREETALALLLVKIVGRTQFLRSLVGGRPRTRKGQAVYLSAFFEGQLVFVTFSGKGKKPLSPGKPGGKLARAEVASLAWCVVRVSVLFRPRLRRALVRTSQAVNSSEPCRPAWLVKPGLGSSEPGGELTRTCGGQLGLVAQLRIRQARR